MDSPNRIALKLLRPAIPTIIEENVTSAAEQFQNRTLRPILKLQNELLLLLFQRYLEQRKGKYFQLSNEAKSAYIEHSVRKDLKLKSLLLGIVIGHFTLEEYEQYHEREKELRKRLTDLLVQRLQSQYKRFVT